MSEVNDQYYEANIGGLEPVNFVTFATPHLGSRGHKQVSVSFLLQLKLFVGCSFLRDSFRCHWFVVVDLIFLLTKDLE